MGKSKNNWRSWLNKSTSLTKKIKEKGKRRNNPLKSKISKMYGVSRDRSRKLELKMSIKEKESPKFLSKSAKIIHQLSSNMSSVIRNTRYCNINWLKWSKNVKKRMCLEKKRTDWGMKIEAKKTKNSLSRWFKTT